jgi:undecaprenyl-diphosphatase
MHAILLFLAKYLIYLIVLAAAIYWLTVPKSEKIRLAVFGAIAGLVTVLLMLVGSKLYYDPRPFVSHHVVPLYPHSADNAFPSDHTAAGAFIALTIMAASRRYGIALLVAAILVGVARVAGHIHSPIDIIGSLVFAAAGAAVAYLLTPKILHYLKLGNHEYVSPHKPAR